MTSTVATHNTLRRDRLWVLAAIAAATVLAWAYIIHMAAGMDAGSMKITTWTPAYALTMFFMWAIMMVGMMLPSAAPMVLLHARVCRKRLGRIAPTGSFLLGYGIAWTLYSVAATSLQWGLTELALLSSGMASTSPAFGAMVLVAAGIYQLTPWKYACLTRCRSPVEFLAYHWRDGAGGAFRMGIGHGTYCVGCCWILMAILFVVGVMNLLWLAAITAFVLVEKVAPAGREVGWFTGAGLILAGTALALTA